MHQRYTASNNYRRWIIVGLSFLALALAYSSRAAFSLIMPLWEQELGWSRSFTSGTAASALIVMAFLAPFGGRLVDRQGARSVILIGLAALALGCLLLALTSQPWAFFLAFAGVSAAGFGLVATHVVSAAVEQEFDTNQGLATGIATSGATGGQLLIVPLIAVFLVSYSWRWAFVALSIATLVMMVAVARWFPKGTIIKQNSDDAGSTGHTVFDDIRQILKRPAFHTLFWSYLICGYTTSGVIETHFLPYALSLGFGPIPSATAYGLLSALNLVGMIGVGWLTDRINRPLLLGGIYLVRGVTFVILINVGADFQTLIFFAIIFGLVDYSTVPVTASLIASHIGIRVMGLAFGLISAGHQVGAALGAYFGGVLFDIYAQYDWVWWSSVWLAVFAGILVLTLRNQPRIATLDA